MAKNIQYKVNRALKNRKYYEIVRHIIESPEFQKRKNFKHHEDCSVYEHCIEVSYLSYRICRKLNFYSRDAAIGGLLHDLYSYPWQEIVRKKDSFFKQHGFVHAAEALDNAILYFPEFVNARVSDIILRHMFPLNIHPPKYPESWVVTFVDKFVSLGVLGSGKELLKYIGLKKYLNKIKK